MRRNNLRLVVLWSKGLFSIIFIGWLFTACSKSENTIEPISSNPHLIKEYLVLDTTLQAPGDTLYKYTFEYDAMDRCKQVKRYAYPTGGGNSTLFFTQDYTYNGNDTLASSISTKFLFTSERRRHYFFYDSQKRLISDSTVDITGTSANDSSVGVARYSYPDNTGFNLTKNIYYPSTEFQDYGFTRVFRDGRDNITLQKMSVSTDFSLEYDHHQNYLKRIFPINAPYIRNTEYVSLLEAFVEQNNYATKIFYNTYDAGGILISSSLFREYYNAFNSDGLIISSQRKTIPSDIYDKYKYIFRY